eukprot:13257145-Alexandrium_andersonii.AAC.1
MPAAPVSQPAPQNGGAAEPPAADAEDQLSRDLWLRAACVKASVLREPPQHLRQSFAVTEGALIR